METKIAIDDELIYQLQQFFGVVTEKEVIIRVFGLANFFAKEVIENKNEIYIGRDGCASKVIEFKKFKFV